MNKYFLSIAIAFCSCKVTDSTVTKDFDHFTENLKYDQIGTAAGLNGKATFKLVSQPDLAEDIAQLNRIFKRKLISNGFTEVDENPDLLIQGVIASLNFETEVLGFSSSVGLTDNSSYSPPSQESGQYGKVIFLIQDAKTNEVIWIGTGTGILIANGALSSKKIKSTLDQLIANSK